MSLLPWCLLGLKPVPWGWTLLKLVWWSNDLSGWEKSLCVWTGLKAVNTGPGSFLKTVDTAKGFDVGAIFLLNFTFGCCWDWPEYNLLDLKYSTFSDSRGLSMSGWYAARKHVISYFPDKRDRKKVSYLLGVEIQDGAREKEEDRGNYWTMLAEGFRIPCEHPQKWHTMLKVPDKIKLNLSSGRLIITLPELSWFICSFWSANQQLSIGTRMIQINRTIMPMFCMRGGILINAGQEWRY